MRHSVAKGVLCGAWAGFAVKAATQRSSVGGSLTGDYRPDVRLKVTRFSPVKPIKDRGGRGQGFTAFHTDCDRALQPFYIPPGHVSASGLRVRTPRRRVSKARCVRVARRTYHSRRVKLCAGLKVFAEATLSDLPLCTDLSKCVRAGG